MTYVALLFFYWNRTYIFQNRRYNIIDKPNSRSSHTAITIRGEGLFFPLTNYGFFAGYVPWEITVAVLVAIVSFIDDIKPLSQLLRFAAHVIAVGLVL
jgi:UDP-N-acetylmuramyl pentapeptide phosphotransferase/UDP-N-acetylglucosamine-1-phosphate transferase